MQKTVFIIFSVVSIIILLIIVSSLIANYRFDQSVKKEAKALLQGVVNKHEIIQEADLHGLPLCVQKWLKKSGVIGKERVTSVRLKQRGLMRMKEGQAWMPSESEQYIRVDKPGFVWKTKVRLAPFIYFTGSDYYSEGKGDMLIKLLSLITIVNAKGKEIDEGTMQRYLAETSWYPTAALNDYISWEEIDAHSAKATMNYGGVTASGIFIFNDAGDNINFVTKRYMEQNGKYVLENWSAPATDFKDFQGIRIAHKSNATWNFKTGDFPWYQVEVTELEYNTPEIY